MSRWLRFRIQLDRIVAGGLLVLVTPLLLIAAVVVRLDDGRPVFIKVPRIGIGGRLFGMWKIRSMQATAPGGLAGGADLTARDDARLTRVGARMRRLRVDELPQLLNVVRGEMALIGPRPEAPGYVDLGDDRWKRILSVPPGIAGATQVLVNRWEADVLRRDTSQQVYRAEVLPLKVALDDWYVSNASPLLDIRVVVGLLTARTRRLKESAAAHVAGLERLPS